MNRLYCNTQSGYALLIFVLLLMGIGGVVIGGFTQQVKKDVEFEKFLHNKRVLEQAKQAMLQFAYNYPVTNQNGPGRLPCPDTDNNGAPNTPFNCGSVVGRLPWNQTNLNLYDIRDADGQRLWYAVSNTFSTQDAGPLNSDTSGTITIRDQTGNIIYDGSDPGALLRYGVAAIIIAPGTGTARNGVAQDRSVANGDDPFDTTADTDPGIVNPVNYLDQLVGTEDNAALVQGGTNGFILGPVDNLAAGSIVVNDQFIVITAQEVIEVAEKATLQSYRTAINQYLNVASECVGGTGSNEAACVAGGGSWNGVYPWLYNYAGIPDFASLSNNYATGSDFATELANNLGNVGRIPSIFPMTFDDYFVEATSPATIETEFGVEFSLTYPVSPTTVTSSDSGELEFNDAAVHELDILTTDILTNVSFVDLADVVGQDGRLTGTVGTPQLFTHELFFWDEDEFAPTGKWTLCPDDGNVINDCHRDNSQVADPGGANQSREEILRVVLELQFDPLVNAGVVNFDTDYTLAPAIGHDPADAGKHALITAIFNGDRVIVDSLPLTARYEIDRHYHESESFTVDESGTLDLADLTAGSLTLALRYFPELPDWAFNDNWHNSLMMAYADDYRPDAGGADGDCAVNGPCLQILGLPGTNNDEISILTLAGEHIWADGDTTPFVALDGSFQNEVGDVFNTENSDLDNVFDMRTLQNTAAPGDGQLDKILVIE